MYVKEMKCAWWKISLVGLEKMKNEELGLCLQLHILGGEEVCTVEDQFNDTELMVM